MSLNNILRINKLFSFLRMYRRFLTLIVLVFAAKLVASLFLYQRLNIAFSNTYWMTVDPGPVGQNEVLTSGVAQGTRWPYLFLGWDSAFYLSILVKGYTFSDQSYAFFPGLPLFSWFFDIFLRNPVHAMVLFSNFVGLLWLPVYQLVAENYLDKTQAFKSTLFYAFFPYIFLFTTVAYSEGLFLLSTLSAWYFFKKNRLLLAMLFSSIATISRPPGILILLPMLIEIFRAREYEKSLWQRRSIVYLLIPLLSFFGWLLYCNLVFNDWLAPFNRTGWDGMYSFRTLLLNISSNNGVQALLEIFQVWPLSSTWIFFLLFSPFLIYAVARIDKALALYSTVYFLGVLAFGGLPSVPRFISFLFPIWLPLTFKLFSIRRSSLLAAIIFTSFYLIGLFLWDSFLDGRFVS